VVKIDFVGFYFIFYKSPKNGKPIDKVFETIKLNKKLMLII
jgi:hypothetical protein